MFDCEAMDTRGTPTLRSPPGGTRSCGPQRHSDYHRSVIKRCPVQASGKALGSMVLQECARWLNLTNLSDRERDDILDMQIVPEGIFGSAFTLMQQRCEARKKEDEALQFCLLRKAAPPQPPRRKTFLPVATPGPQYRIPKRAKTAPTPSTSTSRATWSNPPPAPAAASPPQAMQTVSFQPRRKKRMS